MDTSTPNPTLSPAQGAVELFRRAGRSWLQASTERWIMFLAVVLALLPLLGERIAMRDGLGWEGETYAKWIQDFDLEVFDVGIDAYNIQRVLPAATLHYTFRALGIHPTTKNIVRGFKVINVLSLILVAYYWCKIGQHLQLTTRGKWIGFIGLFCNFAVLKFAPYNAVMTDCPAYASGAAMIYFYLTCQRLGLWTATLLGSMVWPTQLYIGAILGLFPRSKLAKSDSTVAEPESPIPFALPSIIAGLLAYYFFLWSRYSLDRLQYPLWGCMMPSRSVLPLSIVLACLFAFYGLREVLKDQRFYRWRAPSRDQWITAFGTVCVIVAIKVFFLAMASRPGYMSLNVYAFIIGICAVAKPGLFLVSHVAYFGPICLLILWFWKPLCAATRSQGGFGLTLVMLIGVCHALDPETRHLIYLLPMLMPFLVQAMESWNWSYRQIVAFAGLSILLSKCYLYVGGPFQDICFNYPDQLYWMSIGTFMSDFSYYLQGVVLLFVGYLLYVFGRSGGPASEAEQPQSFILPYHVLPGVQE